MMMRKTKLDWLEEGLGLLGSEGLSALTIERLTGRLNVTKGSFYHHFRNVRQFQEELVAHWAEQYLSTAGALPEPPEARLDLLDRIMAETFSPITAPEAAIRVWAQQDEMVRPFVEQVDTLRRRFLYEVFSVVKDPEAALLMADIFYTMSIGSITALPRMAPERFLELYREFKRLYGLGV
jgi:AcrR family transcriptional regulator